MKETKIKELIAQNTNDDGVVDYGVVSKAINEFANGLIAKNKPDTDKLYKEGVANFLKDNNFDDMASFKAFVKNGATADSERVNELKLELENANTQINGLNEIKGEYTTMKNYELIRGKSNGKNFTNDELEFINFKINKNVSDELSYEDALNGYVETNADRFQAQPKKPNYVSTGRTINNNSTIDAKSGVDKILEAKYGDRLK